MNSRAYERKGCFTKSRRVELVERKKPTCAPMNINPMPLDESLIPEMADFGTGYKWHVTGLFHDEIGFPSNSSQVAERLMSRLMNK